MPAHPEALVPEVALSISQRPPSPARTTDANRFVVLFRGAPEATDQWLPSKWARRASALDGVFGSLDGAVPAAHRSDGPPESKAVIVNLDPGGGLPTLHHVVPSHQNVPEPAVSPVTGSAPVTTFHPLLALSKVTAPAPSGGLIEVHPGSHAALVDAATALGARSVALATPQAASRATAAAARSGERSRGFI